MNKTITPRLIAVLVAAAFSGSAAASGFQLLEQNASGLGNAYAGSAAVAENASTIFYNPAGMTQLKDREISLGLTAIKTSYKFTDQGSSVGALGAAGNGGDGGDWGYLPNAYASWALTKDIYVGLGIGAPFGLKTEFNNPWKGGAQSLMFDIKTININPSIAWRVNETVSLGAGVNWQRMEAKYQRLLGIGNAGLASSVMNLKMDDDAWGWNVGALFTLQPGTKVGVSYRSAIKHELDGNLKFSGPLAQSVALGGSATDRTAQAAIKLPDTLILSATHNLNKQIELLADVSWTGWSSVPYVDVVNTQTTGLAPTAQAGNVAQRLDTKFKDTWRVAIGTNYSYNDALKLKAGIAFDQTPVKGPTSRLVSLPDNDRWWLSIGAQWKPSKNTALDVGLARLFVKDSKIQNDQTTAMGPAARGVVSGSFDASAWILGTQFSMAF